YLLSFLEKRAWSIMKDPYSNKVNDKDILEINETLQSVVKYVPLTMQITMGTLTFLLFAQLYGSTLKTIPLIQIALFILLMAIGIKTVLRSIKQLKKSKNQKQSVAEIRIENSRIFIVHHGGLFLSLALGILELIYVNLIS
ncbi:MAG: hypothetical protein AAF734_11755, partial [Bacteroidota bacterium]